MQKWKNTFLMKSNPVYLKGMRCKIYTITIFAYEIVKSFSIIH